MSSPIIGKTKGDASSEFWLTKLAIHLLTAITGGAIIAGLINPQDAAQINEAISNLIFSIASVVAAYTTSRGVLKSVIAWQASQYEEDGNG